MIQLFSFVLKKERETNNIRNLTFLFLKAKLQLHRSREKKKEKKEGEIFSLLSSLVVELCASPVTALFVPLDAVAGAHADPAGNGAVLLNLLSVLLLNSERLEAAHFIFFSKMSFLDSLFF